MIIYDHITKVFTDTTDSTVINFQYSDQTATGATYDINRASEYDIYPLYKNGIMPQEAAEVWLTAKIGCLIPEQSLKTPVADIENKPLYRFYAFLATRYLLEHYMDYYSDADCDKRVFLILERTSLPSGVSHEWYLYGLYHQGIYLKPDKVNSLATNNVLPNKVKCKLCTSYLRQNSYVCDFLGGYYYEADIIRLFLYSYQIIEILIDDVLIDKLNEMIIKCTKGELSLRSNIDESTELSRIKKILNDTQTISRPGLNQDCLNFLLLIGRSRNSIQGFPDSLYQVRNTLTHRLRLVIGNAAALNGLQKINEGFELLLLDILAAYYSSSTVPQNTAYSLFNDIMTGKNL